MEKKLYLSLTSLIREQSVKVTVAIIKAVVRGTVCRYSNVSKLIVPGNILGHCYERDCFYACEVYYA